MSNARELRSERAVLIDQMKALLGQSADMTVNQERKYSMLKDRVEQLDQEIAFAENRSPNLGNRSIMFNRRESRIDLLFPI